MKEGFTFDKVSLMFLRKVIFKNFGGGGGGTEKSLTPCCMIRMARALPIKLRWSRH